MKDQLSPNANDASPEPSPSEAKASALPHQSPSRRILVVVFIILATLVVMAGISAILFMNLTKTSAPDAITTYEQCVAANGGMTNLMYPPTCTTPDGQVFTDRSDVPTVDLKPLSESLQYVNDAFGFSLDFFPPWDVIQAQEYEQNNKTGSTIIRFTLPYTSTIDGSQKQFEPFTIEAIPIASWAVPETNEGSPRILGFNDRYAFVAFVNDAVPPDLPFDHPAATSQILSNVVINNEVAPENDQSYTDPTYGFTFSYPSSAVDFQSMSFAEYKDSVNTPQLDSQFQDIFNTTPPNVLTIAQAVEPPPANAAEHFPAHNFVVYVAANPENLTPEQWFNRYQYYPITYGTASEIVKPTSPINVSGIPGKYQDVTLSTTSRIVLLPNNGNMYLVSYVADSPIDQSIFSTFEFVE